MRWLALLETTFLIDLLKGKSEVIEIMDDLDKREPVLFIAAPTVMELWFGAALSKSSHREREKVGALLNSFEILPLDRNSAKEAGEIEAALCIKGQQIQSEDVMIASIAMVNGQTLVTRDQHYARIPGLRVMKY